MRLISILLTASLAACQPPADAPAGGPDNDASSANPADTPLRPATPRPHAATGEWTEVGGALHFTDSASGEERMILACDSGALSVTLPKVASIDSEERLSFGGGGDVEALVRRAGSGPNAVEAAGPAPERERLVGLLAAGPGASYGATAIGPLVPVPAAMAATFAARCA